MLILQKTPRPFTSKYISKASFEYPQRPFYKLAYNILKNRNQQAQVNQPEETDPQLDIKAARDKYVQEQTREMLFSMRQETIPKGVTFSQIMLTVPLLATTGYLCLLAPMAANTAFVDPV